MSGLESAAGIAEVRAVPVRVPITRAGTMSGAKRTHAARTIVEVVAEDGTVGLGETRTEEAAAIVNRRFARSLVGADAFDRRGARARCLRAHPDYGFPEQRLDAIAFSAVEIAQWDLLGKRAGLPLYSLLGGAVRDAAPFVAYAYAVDPDEVPDPADVPGAMAAVATDAVARTGATLFEFKVGVHPLDVEIAVVHAVREALGSGVALAVDANMGFTPVEAARFLAAVAPCRLANVEEPVAGLAALAALRRADPTPVSTHCVDLDALAAYPEIDAVVPEAHGPGGDRSDAGPDRGPRRVGPAGLAALDVGARRVVGGDVPPRRRAAGARPSRAVPHRPGVRRSGAGRDLAGARRGRAPAGPARPRRGARPRGARPLPDRRRRIAARRGPVMKLSPDQLALYREQGYAGPNPLLDDTGLERVRAEMDALIDALPADNRPENIPSPHYESRLLRDLLLSDPFVDVAEQIIGPDVALFTVYAISKPPRDGRPVNWHQDADYFPIDPIETFTLWLAIDDSTRENGCMQVLPGTHRSRRLLDHGVFPDDGSVLPQSILELDTSGRRRRRGAGRSLQRARRVPAARLESQPLDAAALRDHRQVRADPRAPRPHVPGADRIRLGRCAPVPRARPTRQPHVRELTAAPPSPDTGIDCSPRARIHRHLRALLPARMEIHMMHCGEVGAVVLHRGGRPRRAVAAGEAVRSPAPVRVLPRSRPLFVPANLR